MEMFLQNQVLRNDPRLKITYKNFNDNLEELNHLSHKNDIKIIYSTVVSNLKACPPFSSVHRPDISLAGRQKWDKFYSSGSAYEETGEYNYPYIRRILPGRELAIVHLAYRMQGLMFAAKNPKQVNGLYDLRRKDINFVNRQRGSGTRVLLDLKLRQIGILPHEIKGYEDELDTHLAVALAISHGKADLGLGIEAAAKSCGLDFLPLFRERYDLVMTKADYESYLLSPLLRIVTSDEFRNVVNQVGGYDTSQTGLTTFFG